MGTLQDQDDHPHTLRSRGLVGRAPTCALHVPDRSVSGEHAIIWWDGERWLIRDLASRNGTFVNDERLSPEARAPLQVGAQLRFGLSHQRYKMVSAAPPGMTATDMENGEELVEADGQLAFPDPDAPLAVVFQVRSGLWRMEAGGVAVDVKDLQVVRVAGRQWRLNLPEPLMATPHMDAPASLRGVRLQFNVSQDEEHVHVVAKSPVGEVDLGTPVHNYMLLTLARARLSGDGWTYVDELTRALRVSTSELNQHVFRARRQAAKSGLLDANALIERRTDSRQLRIGVSDLVIEIV